MPAGLPNRNRVRIVSLKKNIFDTLESTGFRVIEGHPEVAANTMGADEPTHRNTP
jgi:predicted nuclease with RNAse H fold